MTWASPTSLPDKAIDLVDEACAVIRTEIDSMPAELDELTRRVMRLEIEETALAKEEDPASQARLEELRKELADLRAESDALRAEWEGERQALRRVQALRAEMEQVRQEAEHAERDYDLNTAAELRLGRLPELQRRLRAEEDRLSRRQDGHRLLREVVTDDERRDRGPLDGNSGQSSARRRAGEDPSPRSDPARARGRPGRGGSARHRRHHPGAIGNQGSASAHRVFHLPRPDGRRAAPST